LDDSHHALHEEMSALREELSEYRKDKRSRSIAKLTLASGLFIWWQAFALGLPESLGIGLAVAGVILLLIRA
jgi:ubiquinone biosynthesis protein